MAVSLTKGQRVSLEKISPGLSEVFIGLGWDVKATDTCSDFDRKLGYKPRPKRTALYLALAA